MNFKTKLIFSAALAAALMVLPRAGAANSGEPAPAPADASPDAMTNSVATNATSADSMTALFGDPVIAKGNGFEIKQSALDEVMVSFRAAAEAHGETIPPEQLPAIESQMLDRLIQIQLLLQKATDADKAEGKKEADEQIATLRERAGSSETLDLQLKAVGTTLDELRAKVTQEATAMATLQRELNVTVTDSEVEQYYTNHPAEVEQPEQAHVRHLLLMTIDPTTHEALPDDQVQAKKNLMEDILKRARAGEDFAALAKQYSEDPGSKDNGGELQPLSRDQMDYLFGPEFEAAAFTLTNNQISDVVTTQYGYDIIQLLGKTPAKKLALTDKVPPTDETVADQIKNFLTQQKIDKRAPDYLAGLKKNADVEILDPDLKAAAEAADAAATNMPPDAVPEN